MILVPAISVSTFIDQLTTRVEALQSESATALQTSVGRVQNAGSAAFSVACNRAHKEQLQERCKIISMQTVPKLFTSLIVCF